MDYVWRLQISNFHSVHRFLCPPSQTPLQRPSKSCQICDTTPTDAQRHPSFCNILILATYSYQIRSKTQSINQSLHQSSMNQRTVISRFWRRKNQQQSPIHPALIITRLPRAQNSSQTSLHHQPQITAPLTTEFKSNTHQKVSSARRSPLSNVAPVSPEELEEQEQASNTTHSEDADTEAPPEFLFCPDQKQKRAPAFSIIHLSFDSLR
eukprot:05878_3